MRYYQVYIVYDRSSFDRGDVAPVVSGSQNFCAGTYFTKQEADRAAEEFRLVKDGRTVILEAID